MNYVYGVFNFEAFKPHSPFNVVARNVFIYIYVYFFFYFFFAGGELSFKSAV